MLLCRSEINVVCSVLSSTTGICTVYTSFQQKRAKRQGCEMRRLENRNSIWLMNRISDAIRCTEHVSTRTMDMRSRRTSPTQQYCVDTICIVFIVYFIARMHVLDEETECLIRAYKRYHAMTTTRLERQLMHMNVGKHEWDVILFKSKCENSNLTIQSNDQSTNTFFFATEIERKWIQLDSM